ncbi:unnamed protein product [Pedinophyceae sp. YPF-701]|nr:unnamed protein product [Pedinophyceae sp. YPF-701]
MVQAEPILGLTLSALGGSGCVLSAETRNAIEVSLDIKKSETGLDFLYLWGRITTRNGKDYLVAEGHSGGKVFKGAVSLPIKHFFSQDGTTWADLPETLSPEELETCSKIALKKTIFTGDPATILTPDGTAVGGEEGDAAPAEGDEAQKGVQVTELQRLKHVVEAITNDCLVVPRGAFVENASNKIIPNGNFNGVHHPEKLESYQHFTRGPDTPKSDLGENPRGSWSITYDGFRGVAVGRSNVWLGYSFYFNTKNKTFGGLYFGDGNKNTDLIFML